MVITHSLMVSLMMVAACVCVKTPPHPLFFWGVRRRRCAEVCSAVTHGYDELVPTSHTCWERPAAHKQVDNAHAPKIEVFFACNRARSLCVPLPFKPGSILFANTEVLAFKTLSLPPSVAAVKTSNPR